MDIIKDRQIASAALRFGKSFRARAHVDVSPVGLVSIGLMVSAVLLGSAVIVAVARQPRGRQGPGQRELPGPQ